MHFALTKTNKPHNIAEELILPAEVEMVQTKLIVDEKEAAKLKTMPLSIILSRERRISDTAKDIRTQIVEILITTRRSYYR